MTDRESAIRRAVLDEHYAQRWCLERAIDTYGMGDHIQVLEAANAYLKWLKA
jgi:hypothetical protein